MKLVVARFAIDLLAVVLGVTASIRLGVNPLLAGLAVYPARIALWTAVFRLFLWEEE